MSSEIGKESVSAWRRSKHCRHEGAEPRIGVPLLGQKLRDPGMPAWKALEHILTILTHESTQAAAWMRLEALRGHKDNLVHPVGITVLGVKLGSSLVYHTNLQEGVLVP